MIFMKAYFVYITLFIMLLWNKFIPKILVYLIGRYCITFLSVHPPFVLVFLELRKGHDKNILWYLWIFLLFTKKKVVINYEAMKKKYIRAMLPSSPLQEFQTSISTIFLFTLRCLLCCCEINLFPKFWYTGLVGTPLLFYPFIHRLCLCF